MLDYPIDQPTKLELTLADWIVARFDTGLNIFDPDHLAELGDIKHTLKAYDEALGLGPSIARIPLEEFRWLGGDVVPPTVHGRLRWQPSILFNTRRATYYGREVDLYAALWLHPDLACGDTGTAQALFSLAPPFASDKRRTIHVREFLRIVDQIEHPFSSVD